MSGTLTQARRGGRPGRMTRQDIVTEALTLLEQDGFDAFSLARLAQRIGVTTMALYKYYPSRDALLDAVVERIIEEFHYAPEDLGDGWEDALAGWFDALLDLFERYPIAVRLTKWEQHEASPAWLTAWLPMVKLLANNLGLTGERLIMAAGVVGNTAMGLVTVYCARRQQGRPTLFDARTGDAATDAVLEDLTSHYYKVSPRTAINFAVRSVVTGLRDLVEAEKAAKA